MNRLMALVLIGAQLVFMLPQRAFADDSDIFGANIQPNVLIIIDNSGSMADDVPSNAYDTATSYPLLVQCDPVTTKKPKTTTYSNCATNKVYQSSTSGVYDFYKSDIASVTGTPTSSAASARSALTSDGYWSGKINGSTVNLFTGNYINYLLGSCANGGACIEPKMQVAQRVVNSLLDNVKGVRFGIMTFYYGSNGVRGGRVVAQIGTGVSTMKSAVNALTPTSDTPLGDVLYDAGQYYKGLQLTNGTQFSTPIQLECQPSFAILITDGLQTSGSRLMVNEATNRYQQDHSSSFSNKQNVIVHTVGFGVTVNTSQSTSDQALADLDQAAKNGGGQFFQSDSATALEKNLQDAIKKIIKATFTFANPVLPTTSTTGSTRAYLASFESDASSPFWKGALKAYQRDSRGLVPLETSGPNIGKPLASALIWDAGQVLNGIASASRTIHTVVSGSITPFTKSNSAITQSLLGVSTSTARDNIIDFVRGVDLTTGTDRGWKLGDIFHSTPVLVTPPVRALNDSSYQAFKSAKASRTTILLAGSNDGMLHAFRESDGAELWAFIPPDILDDLSAVTVSNGDHPFFVDSSPIAVDIKDAGAWKTIVVFGLRRGGAYYYALDITDTLNPTYLWSFTDSKIRESWSEPAIGKVKIGGVDKYVAFFGGGYNTSQNNAHGKAVFAVDVATGTKLWEYYNDGSSDDRQYMNFSIPANPTAIDINNDGYVDHVYIGDVGGQMWKFDVSASATTSWTGKRLFRADTSQANPPVAGEFYATQAIYGAPSLAQDSDMNLWVFFGTGDRNHPNNTASNRFYGIKDNTTMSNGSALTESNLVDVTTSSASPTQGWFYRLGTSEKVLAASNVFNMNVFFSGFTPTTTVSCVSGSGDAKLYAVQVESGLAAINFATGTALTSPNTSTARSTTIGTGIASMPVIVITPPDASGGSATSSVITATSDQQLPNNPVPPPPFLKTVRSWRERIQ
jgi:type IV pilus assembly protein PilY1